MKKKFLNFFAIIFLGIFSALLFYIVTKEEPKPVRSFLEAKFFDKKFSGKALAIDGDSLKVDGKEVRLMGIDAPEYSQNCFDAQDKEYACGHASQKFTANLVDGKEVTCFYAQKDVYNRFLAKCFIGEVSVNEEILKNGMAVIYSFASSDSNMEELEKSAKKNRVGIWQGKFQLPKEYRKSHPRLI
jgi:endonuclease YncB( thermonuclease family)